MRTYGSVIIQGFTPHIIWNGTNLETEGVIAVRCTSILEYQINGEGEVGTMLGTTVIQNTTTSLYFPSGPVTLELMLG